MDNLFSYFEINPITGIVCKQTSLNYEALLEIFLKSPLKYMDNSKNICYNLQVFASSRQIASFNELQTIKYDNSNCSFNFYKVCIDKFNCNFQPPLVDNSIPCEAGKS